ncbi:hypothetical protein MHBO_000005 [Bonamia ostreae]|uniref:Uncharacterized protein n=1 Tax=Bonamia ostreae TaxID=126728 RepID=A0ABV2AE37_9EUKA
MTNLQNSLFNLSEAATCPCTVRPGTRLPDSTFAGLAPVSPYDEIGSILRSLKSRPPAPNPPRKRGCNFFPYCEKLCPPCKRRGRRKKKKYIWCEKMSSSSRCGKRRSSQRLSCDKYNCPSDYDQNFPSDVCYSDLCDSCKHSYKKSYGSNYKRRRRYTETSD